MFGFGDVWVFLAYFMALASMVLCVVYGIVNWNNPKEDVGKEALEEAKWEEKDPDLNEGGAK